MGRLGNLILAILKKRAWYIILVISSSLYVLKYHKEIFDFTEIKMNATNLIFLIWVFCCFSLLYQS